MQLNLFESPYIKNKEQLLLDLFQAYYNARKNKRKTINALAFEVNYESNLFQLHKEILNQKYEPSPSICFINLAL